jgi:membrane protease YdiL (CAAX protease family)
MSLDGGKLGWNAAAIRNLLRLVDLPLALVGALYFMVKDSPRRQRLGDRAARTIVVREPEPVASAPAAVQTPPPAGPTAGELFGAATQALAGPAGRGNREALGPARASDTHPGARPEAGPEDEGEAPQRADAAAGRLPYATWPVGRTVWGVLIGLALGGLLLPIPVIAADPELESSGALIAVQAILGATLMATAMVVAGADRGWPGALRRLGLRRFKPSAIGWMFPAYGGYVAAIALYAAFVVEPDQEDIARELGLDASVVAAILSVLLIAIVAPFAEELFFRGLLFGGLRVRMAALPAALISGAVFGGLHATTGITTVPPLIFFGVALALLYEKTGSLWPPIFLHLLNNSLALALSA